MITAEFFFVKLIEQLWLFQIGDIKENAGIVCDEQSTVHQKLLNIMRRFVGQNNAVRSGLKLVKMILHFHMRIEYELVILLFQKAMQAGAAQK